MIHPYKKKSLARLKKARGQIEGIINMIEEDKYCNDILIQLLALEGSLKGVSYLILESHLNTCGAENLGSSDVEKKDRFIKEIVKVFELSNR
jgi:CsoR family transcriptional regulator, copper-sensing transcriptional repressor